MAALGHLPKRGGENSRAWLYGKLVTALLTEKLMAHSNAVSPGGTTFRTEPARSRRRGFRFVLNQVRRTVEPAPSLREVIDGWTGISRGLADPPGPRRPRMERYFPKTDPSKTG